MPPLSACNSTATNEDHYRWDKEKFPHPDISFDISYTNIYLSNEDKGMGSVSRKKNKSTVYSEVDTDIKD